MDPVTILGAVGSVGSIVDIVAKIFVVVDRLYHSYGDAPAEVDRLRAELLLVQSTIEMICIISRQREDVSLGLSAHQQQDFFQALLGAKHVLRQVHGKCLTLESRFKPRIGGKLAWAISDRRRVGELQEKLKSIQSSLSGFIIVKTLCVGFHLRNGKVNS